MISYFTLQDFIDFFLPPSYGGNVSSQKQKKKKTFQDFKGTENIEFAKNLHFDSVNVAITTKLCIYIFLELSKLKQQDAK